MNRPPVIPVPRLSTLADFDMGSPQRRDGLQYIPGLGKWRLKRSLDELMPEFRRLYSASPAETGTLTNSGVGTIALDGTTSETMGRSLKLTMGNSQQVVFMDLAEPVKAGGSIRIRLKAKNWPNQRDFAIQLYASSDHTGPYHEALIHGVTHDYFGCRSYPWTNEEWRTLTIHRNHFIDVSDPEDWGGTDGTWEKTIGSIGFFLAPVLGSGENLEVWIDRIDSPVWPVAFVCITGDNTRGTFVEHVAEPFYRRGWNLAMTCNALEDNANLELASMARYREWAAKIDMSVHGRQIAAPYGGFGGATGTDKGDALDCEEGTHYWHQGARRLIPEMRHPTQFLYALWTDNGNYDGTDLAGVLARGGVLGSRGGMWDGTMRVPARYGFHGPLNNNRCTDPVPCLGPYNYPFSPANKDSWSNDEPFLLQAVRQKMLFSIYTHGVFPTASDFNITEAYASEMIESLAAVEDHVEFVTLRDLYYLTYGRPGDRYVEHRGEWKSRLNSAWVPA